ncbi:hypothetical protein GGR56DRAFT_459691 [Xylariaceae sp. FL0804]|nr:hypothetical protein GGR56DRAFT_459691 [Xylariaceae sp. FL0804]
MEYLAAVQYSPMELDVTYAGMLWRSLSIQIDTPESMPRFLLTEYQQLGRDGREFLLQSARDALLAMDIEFFTDTVNAERVTLVSRSRVLARGYQVLNLLTSPLPTLMPPRPGPLPMQAPHFSSQSHGPMVSSGMQAPLPSPQSYGPMVSSGE